MLAVSAGIGSSICGGFKRTGSQIRREPFHVYDAGPDRNIQLAQVEHGIAAEILVTARKKAVGLI